MCVCEQAANYSSVAGDSTDSISQAAWSAAKNLTTCKHGKGKQLRSKASQAAIMQLTAALSNGKKKKKRSTQQPAEFRISTPVPLLST